MVEGTQWVHPDFMLTTGPGTSEKLSINTNSNEQYCYHLIHSISSPPKKKFHINIFPFFSFWLFLRFDCWKRICVLVWPKSPFEFFWAGNVRMNFLANPRHSSKSRRYWTINCEKSPPFCTSHPGVLLPSNQDQHVCEFSQIFSYSILTCILGLLLFFYGWIHYRMVFGLAEIMQTNL